MKTTDHKFLSLAGRLIDKHGMYWTRHLKSPIEQVWSMVSTKQGLETWWLTPPEVFDLRVGGLFSHHWDNTITGFRELDYIDFGGRKSNYSGTGGMRFELVQTPEQETIFMFLDTWEPNAVPLQNGSSKEFNVQFGGTGTPWPGVAAGWHAMVDRLENQFDTNAQSNTYEELCNLYVGYLNDLYRWHEMIQRV